jgi:hypothetical protein
MFLDQVPFPFPCQATTANILSIQRWQAHASPLRIHPPLRKKHLGQALLDSSLTMKERLSCDVACRCFVTSMSALSFTYPSP